nr:Hypothetical protein [Pseudomonas aeruginosa]
MVATGLMVTVALPFSWPRALAGSKPTVQGFSKAGSAGTRATGK